jgi:Flp pilus assembly protein TadG
MRELIARRLANRHDEGGAVAVIVALCMIAIFAMVVLTVDVGGLLLERRSMVNAADAGALAAAKTCAQTGDTEDPEEQSDIYAKENVTDLPADGIDNITEIVGCDTGSGHVSVSYSEQHDLFFAAVLPGQDNSGTITTKATASWGPLAGGFAIPVVLDKDYVQSTCKVPDGIEIGDTCAFWYNNNDTTGSANWGFMNLSQWNVDPGAHCSNSGSSSRADWIANGYPDIRLLNGSPPGSAATYVCNDTGHSARNWKDLSDEEGHVKLFPINDCDGQISKGGTPAPCPATPDKYDIVGFSSLLIQHVYKGNDTAAIGTPGVGATCSKDLQSGSPAFDADGDVTTLQPIDLTAFGTYGPACGSFSSASTITNLKLSPLKGADYVQCPSGVTTGCHYTYDPNTKTIQWVATGTGRVGTKESDDDVHISFDWDNAGTPGACGIHPSDPNAICLVTEWRGFTTGPGPIGSGTNFGVGGITLCDLDYSVGCPDQG